MKKLLTFAAVGVCTACGGEGGQTFQSAFCQEAIGRVETFMDQARTEHPVPDDPRYGGTLVVGAYGEMGDGMNAAVSTGATGDQHQNFVNLMTLIDYDENYEPRPYLAESWDLAPDSTSITFHLRRDVVWHDGEPTDAHDVAFTWATINDPATGYPGATDLDFFVKGPGGYEVLDDYTIRINMRPHPQFMGVFRAQAILPEHLLGDVPHDELAQHPYGSQCPVGNGPFVFAEHRPQDRWVFTANPAFPEGLGGRPFVDRYVYRIVTEQTTLLTELLTESVDAYIAPASEQAQQIIDDPNLELINFVPRQYNYIGWNSRRPQLAEASVRRALTMAMDRESMVEAVVQGYGSVAHTSVPPFHWAYDPSVFEPLPYDPDSARVLLDAAGWRDRDGDGVRESEDGTPFSITLKYNQNTMRQQIAEIVQAQLAQVGVDAQPRVVEYTTLVDQMTGESRDFDAIVMGWQLGFDIDDTPLFSSDIDGPLALTGTHNADMDRLMAQLRVTADRDAAKQLWAEYQRVLIQEQPYTFLYFPDRLVGLNKRVKNAHFDARGEWENLKDWYLDPASR
ncbi:MAG: ABC transporter substrate-binding protein [Gemmatimonadota bacterium]|jgi:peptide/nickel transport system substrate-binding protein